MCDIINGIQLGPAFLAHGIATFSVMAIFNESNASHVITPMLIMEASKENEIVYKVDSLNSIDTDLL